MLIKENKPKTTLSNRNAEFLIAFGMIEVYLVIFFYERNDKTISKEIEKGMIKGADIANRKGMISKGADIA